MKIITDQLGKNVIIEKNPQRIISLVPSQTEFLYDLGLEQEIIGITKFCIHPNRWFRTKTRIGGTKQYNFDKIDALKPDLIIGNKEENDKKQIQNLSKKYPVWLSDIYTFDDAINMMRAIGLLVGKTERAEEIINKIIVKRNQFEIKRNRLFAKRKALKVAYFIWRKPFMVAANETYIHEMLQLFGLKNLFQDQNRYPEIELVALKNTELDIIFLSSEPYPFKEKHVEEIQAILPNVKILIVDGEMFSWYGSRMLKAFDYFEELLLVVDD